MDSTLAGGRAVSYSEIIVKLSLYGMRTYAFCVTVVLIHLTSSQPTGSDVFDEVPWRAAELIEQLKSTGGLITSAQIQEATKYALRDFFSTSDACGISRRVNVALNQPAAQQSTYHLENSWASNAVDGNKTTVSCTGDPWGQFPWWSVDLGSLLYVDTVVVFNDANIAYAFQRLNNFTVSLSNVSPQVVPPTWLKYTIPCGQYIGSVPTSGVASVACPLNTPPARYVIIQGHSDAVCLAEVEVYIR
jgi:hypothetical protein